jgi:hypothetical protein
MGAFISEASAGEALYRIACLCVTLEKSEGILLRNPNSPKPSIEGSGWMKGE